MYEKTVKAFFEDGNFAMKSLSLSLRKYRVCATQKMSKNFSISIAG